MWKPSSTQIDHSLAVTFAGALDLCKIFNLVEEGERKVEILVNERASYIAKRNSHTNVPSGRLVVWAIDSITNRLKEIEHEDEIIEVHWNRFGSKIKVLKAHDGTAYEERNLGFTVECADVASIAWHLLTFRHEDILIRINPQSTLRVTPHIRLTSLVYLAAKCLYLSEASVKAPGDLIPLYAEGLAYLNDHKCRLEKAEDLFEDIPFGQAATQAKSMLESMRVVVKDD